MAEQQAQKHYTFSALCKHLQLVSAVRGDKTKTKNARRDALKQLFTSIAKTTGGMGQRENVYAFMRLLMPEEDRTRMYGLKEATLGQLYADVSGAGGIAGDEMRRGTMMGEGASGDFSEMISRHLQTRCTKSAGLTVFDVNELLDKLSAGSGEARNRARAEAMRAFLCKLDFEEHKWLVRIILRMPNLKLGCQYETILKAYHQDAAAAYAHSSDLAVVCAQCSDPGFKVDSGAGRLNLFTPAHAMLAESCSCERAAAKLGDEFLVEHKLDGERIQAHCQRLADGRLRVEYWSRNRRNSSKTYASDLDTPLSQWLSASVRCCILDGEVLTWDLEADRAVPFGKARSVQLSHDKGELLQLQPRYFVFDVLMLNNASLLDEPLCARRRTLAALVRAPLSGVPGEAQPAQQSVQLMRGWEVRKRGQGGAMLIDGGAERTYKSTSLCIAEKLDEAMVLGHEGLVLKPLQGRYEPNRRGWVKEKPDYNEGYFRTLDLLVLGGYRGSASTGHWKSNGVSHFLLGLFAPPGTPVEANGQPAQPPVFTIAKVGTGYTREELRLMRAFLDPIGQRFDRDKVPPHFCNWRPSSRDDVPSFWYPPHLTLVLEVKAYELLAVEQKAWRSGFNLRFPRVVHIRYDKSPPSVPVAEAQGHAEVVELALELQRSGKILSNCGERTDGQAPAEVQRKKARTISRAITVLGGTLDPSLCRARDGLTQAEQEGLFGGREVVVLTHSTPLRDELHKLAVDELNATVSMQVSRRTRFVIVDEALGQDGLHGREAPPARLQASSSALELLRQARAFDAARAACEREASGGPGSTARAELPQSPAGSCAAAAANPQRSTRGQAGRKAATPAKRPKAGELAWSFEQLDILTVSWLRACHAEQQLLPSEPRYALHVGAESRAQLAGQMDRWGDRYTRETDVEQLRTCVQLVRRELRLERAATGRPVPDVHESLRASGVDDDALLRLDPRGLLRHPRRCVALVPADLALGVPCSTELLRGTLACEVLQLRLLGARVVHEAAEECVSTVVLPDGEEGERRAAALRDSFVERNAGGGMVCNVAYVRSSWVDECARTKSWAPEEGHRIALPPKRKRTC